MYQSARPSRFAPGLATTSSADAELASSLTQLRNRSRALLRDAAYPKRARSIVQNNVVGTGIGLQAAVGTTRNGSNDRVNAAIEREFEHWSRAENCHVGGALHFSDLERLAIGEVFAAGEVLVRKHYFRVGASRVPLALEFLEAERLADNYELQPLAGDGADVRMGIEVDRFLRPVAYWLRARHRGDVRSAASPSEALERVPAADIVHVRVVDRWPQTRGEPWLHAVIRKLGDMDGYSESELEAAYAASCYMGFIETPDLDTPIGERQPDGTEEMKLESGAIDKLGPGEKFNQYAPNRPNAAMDPFMRMMLREVAAGIGVSYESLSRDYSQSNYSSSRLALLDDRDLWRVLQQWFIRSFRAGLHRVWLQQAVLAGALPEIGLGEYGRDPEKFEAVRWKPRGWSWVDPTKEVTAYKEAVKGGLTTLTDVIAQTAGGLDIEDVITTRRRELDLLEAADIDVDTTVGEPAEPAKPAVSDALAAPEDEQPSDADEKAPAGRVLSMGFGRRAE